MEVKPVKSGWYNAFRPWTLHGAVVPVVIGGVVAYHDGYCDWLILILILIGACLLQSAANLLNTYGDFKSGLDNADNHSRSPELVTGTLRPKSVLYAGLGCLAVTAAIGLVLIWHIGFGILWFGLAGIAGAAFYTIGPAYKYYGLGQPLVFVMMGILMPLGTYYALAGTLTYEILLIALPNAFLITAVLSGNELRDFVSDRDAGIRTLSVIVGYDRGMMLYRAYSVLPYIITAVLVVFGILPYAALLVFVSLVLWWPLIQNSRKAKDDKHCGFMLVPLMFRLNWVFGALLAIGYIIGYYLL